MSETYFKILESLSERYNISPFEVDKQMYYEVIFLYDNIIGYMKREGKLTDGEYTDNNGNIHRPAANDDWY